MNVTELYRELKMTKDEFFATVHELGFDIGERAIKIDDGQAVKIIQAIKKSRNTGKKKSLFADAEAEQPTESAASEGKPLPLPEKITVKNFAEKLDKRVPDMMAILMQNGIMATINEQLDYETAAIIAEDMGYTPNLSLEDSVEDASGDGEMVEQAIANEDSKTLVVRPPVIVIMGHVDHGKTTLLDTIRKTEVTAGESGGITQHIGAYQVDHNDKTLTFIDTPGHEAFTAMRSRGARVADIAILVVAADDGVKQQTIEAIHIIQEAELPFIVAINKIDRPGADVERAKKELAELNVIPEDYGGNIVCAAISAKEGTGITELLDTVQLVVDLQADSIVANPAGQTVGTIIESHVDAHTGPVATVLIQNGTLRRADIVQVGTIPGKVRLLRDWRGDAVDAAGPATPVQVLGLKEAPVVGNVLRVVTDKKQLKNAIRKYDSFGFLKKTKKDENDKTKLTLVLRADTLGSLEAIVQSLLGINHEEVGIDIIQKGLGSVTENDVALAASSGAHVLGFHTSATPGAEKFARDESVDYQQFTVIYQLIDYAKEQLEKLLTDTVTLEKTGSVKILAAFRSEATYKIIGGKVDDGVVNAQAPVKIVRGGTMVGEGVLSQLQKEKKNVGEVNKGSECGMRIDTQTDIQPGDSIEAYKVVTETRSL